MDGSGDKSQCGGNAATCSCATCHVSLGLTEQQNVRAIEMKPLKDILIKH